MIESKVLISDYKKYRNKRILILLGGLIILALLIFYCTSIGITDSNIKTVIKTCYNQIKGYEIKGVEEKVIWNLRLPRTLLAVLSGMGLAISGTIMQGITRNPLVSPFTIGVSSAAAFGASIAIVFGWSLFGSHEIGIVSNAFLFALLCAAIIFIISSRLGLSPQSLILTGIALNYLFQALSTSIQFIAEETKLTAIVQWTFGSLNGAEWISVKTVLLFMLPCMIILFSMHRSLSIMSTMNDEISISMGVSPKFVRLVTSILSVIITAAIISFTGVIGFVGLSGPHIARFLVGNDYEYLLSTSALVGAVLVLISDTIGRTILSPVIIPVGIVISFVGVPILMHQIVRSRRKS